MASFQTIRTMLYFCEDLILTSAGIYLSYFTTSGVLSFTLVSCSDLYIFSNFVFDIVQIVVNLIHHVNDIS